MKPNFQLIFQCSVNTLQKPFWLYFVNTADKRLFSWTIACLCQAMSLDQDDETIYADFDTDAYNDLIEYQFSNIVKLMSGLGMGESIQEKGAKEAIGQLGLTDGCGELKY